MPTAPTAPSLPAFPSLPTTAFTPTVPTLPPTFAGRPPCAFTPQPTAPVKKRPRRPLGPILLLLVLAGGGFAAYKFVLTKKADEASMSADASTPAGTGLSPVAAGPQTALAALPLLEFENPPAQTAEWIETRTHLSVDGTGAVNTTTTQLEHTADFVNAVGRIDATSSSASATATTTGVYTPGFLYKPGEAFGAPWTRQPMEARERASTTPRLCSCTTTS